MGKNDDSTTDSQKDRSSRTNAGQSSDKMLAGQKADVDALAANAAEKGMDIAQKAGGKESESYDRPSAADQSIPSSVDPKASPNEAAQGSSDSSSSGDE